MNPILSSPTASGQGVSPLAPRNSGINRRTFIQQSTAAVLATALALDAFRTEAHADEAEGSGKERIGVIYYFKIAGDLTLPVAEGYQQGEGANGVFGAIINAITNGDEELPPRKGEDDPVPDGPYWTREYIEAEKPNTALNPIQITVAPNNLNAFEVNYAADGKTVTSVKIRGGVEFAVLIMWAND